MLSAANLRKNKGQSVSLLLFVLIAAMLLNVGLTIFLGIGTFFDERAERVHMAHYTAMYAGEADAIDKGRQFMESYPGVAEIETVHAVGGMGDYFMGGMKTTCTLFFTRADGAQTMDAPSLIGDSRPLTGDAIYIPYFMLLGGGYQVGDEFIMNLSGVELAFTVAGGTEEIMFGAQMNTVYRFYVPDERFYQMQAQFPLGGITLLSARLENGDEAVFFKADYNEAVSTAGLIFDLLYDNAKQARTMIPTIAGIVVTAFAIILLIVSMIVIRFRIANSIEESMTNIGAQKAIGYRSIQIVSSIVLQFGLIALAGGIVGVALSQAVIPAIMGLLEPMIAMVWNPGFDSVTAAVSMASILLTITLIAYLAARRINKLHPLTALRGGIHTHSFTKNVVPLDTARGPLGLLLALKQVLRNPKQVVTVSVIVAAVTMAAVSGIAMNHNMGEGQGNFARALLGEMPDVNFLLKEDGGGGAFKERLLARPEVRKAFGYETGVPLLVHNISIAATVAEDCSQLESSMLIQGRYPKHNNEIALGTAISKVTGKNVGDTVAVKSGDNEKTYLVTGIAQFMQSNGFNGIITGDGLAQIRPGFAFVGYNAYLTEDADVKAFIQSVEAAEGDVFDGVMDIRDQLSMVMGSIGGIFAAVAVGIAAVTVLVVILVLYMVIKTTILRRRRELGIQKAVGFTTFQLMNQIALNMTPVILLGTALGAVAGYFGLNPMVAALMSSMGIVKVQLPVPIDQTLLICLALAILAYGVSLLIAWRIRKISAYALVSE